MKTSNDKGFEMIFKSLYDLFYILITEYPVTFIFLIILIGGYYIVKTKKMKKYIMSKPKEKLPFLIEKYYFDTNSNWNIIRLFIRLVEFCLILFLSLYMLNIFGLKIPEEVFGNKNNSNANIEVVSKCDDSVVWGDIDICLPLMNDMIECYSNPIIKSRADISTMEGTTILGIYINNETFNNLDTLNETGIDDYFRIFAYDDLKRASVKTSELDDINEKVTSGYVKGDEIEINNFFEKHFNDISIGRMILVEKYVPCERARGSVVITKLKEGEDESVMILISHIVQIKNRLIFSGYYKEYEDTESIKKAKAKSDYFTLLMLDENK